LTLTAPPSGCKGCTTTYRPNAITGSVLEVRPAQALAPVAKTANDLMAWSEKSPEPPTSYAGRTANTRCIVTINDIEQDGIESMQPVGLVPAWVRFEFTGRG
jgi:ribonucleoside-diphosphate reductase alpha chain